MLNAKQIIETNNNLDIFLACQPVYTKSKDVAALELLLQHHGDGKISITDLQSSLALVLGTYGNIYQSGKINAVPVFLKVTDKILLDPNLPELPKKQYILELSDGPQITDILLQRLKQLADKGYRIALSDYNPEQDDLESLLETVHMVKLDIQKLDSSGINQAIGRLKPYSLDLLANGIETQEQFRACIEYGFTYYQGNFLSTPTPIKGKKISSNKLLLLQLLAELQKPNITTARLEEIAINDADFTYRILKIVNSAALGSGKTVKSISHALSLLGTDEIRRWINLMLIDNPGNKPQQLTRNMLIRGRTCEILAELGNRSTPTDYFIVGLLSQLDVLMDITMEDLMSQVPLNQDIKEALLHRKGDMGDILLEVENYEKGDFQKLRLLQEKSYYEVAYRHSTAWATQAQLSMQG